ncbi:hypothetical protein GQ42DRAFT_156344 [Ramicandelaber brevisporus]|nr:hypothetical protein GQ42DRAFT_156344 [Ramicandelaber brevisporus]
MTHKPTTTPKKSEPTAAEAAAAALHREAPETAPAAVSAADSSSSSSAAAAEPSTTPSETPAVEAAPGSMPKLEGGNIDQIRSVILNRKIDAEVPERTLRLVEQQKLDNPGAEKQAGPTVIEDYVVPAEELPHPHRLIWPGSLVTRDFRPNRLNVTITSSGVITNAFYS